MQELEERFARLSHASLPVTEDLEFDSVLQGVLDSVRSLTQARCGAIALQGEDGLAEGFLSLWTTPIPTVRSMGRTWGAPRHGVDTVRAGDSAYDDR